MIIFTEWLKDKGIFEEFKENTLKSSWGRYNILTEKPTRAWVAAAFNWRSTRHGDDFWRDVCVAWGAEIAAASLDEISFGSWEPKIRLINPKEFR